MRLGAGVLFVGGSMAAASGAWAHHGSAPHFFMDRDVEIAGTVRSFEARNPHSFVNVEVAEEGGAAVVWRCELNSIASIRRAGIDESTFTPGARVRLTGHPARHGEHECYFRTAEFADGRVVSQGQVPPTALPQATAPAIEQTQLFGTWARKVVAAGGVAGPGMMQFLTPAGRAASAAYDAYRDDPARNCSPVSPQRLWGNPVQPVEITRDGDLIVLKFEFMDAVREVYLNRTAPPVDAPRTVLGASVGPLRRRHAGHRELAVRARRRYAVRANGAGRVCGHPAFGSVPAHGAVALRRSDGRARGHVDSRRPVVFHRRAERWARDVRAALRFARRPVQLRA